MFLLYTPFKDCKLPVMQDSDMLKYVDLPLMTNAKCVGESENLYSSWQITKNMVCAGYTGFEMGGCQGDSG